MRYVVGAFVLLAVLAALFVWWVSSRLAALTAKALPEGDVLASATDGPMEAWRASVLRPAIRYREAVQQAAALTTWVGWPWALASSRLYAEAATIETLPQLRARARAIGIAASALATLERDGFTAEAAEVRAAQAEVRASLVPEVPMETVIELAPMAPPDVGVLR